MLEKNESHNMFYHIIRDKVRSFRNIWISFKFNRKMFNLQEISENEL